MPKLLNVGITALKSFQNYSIIHQPIIKTVERSLSDKELEAIKNASFFIITSKIAAYYFLSRYADLLKKDITILSIGPQTTQAIHKLGFPVSYEAKECTQEGIIELLKTLNLSKESLLLPNSSLSRSVLKEYLQGQAILFEEITLYDTVKNPEFKKINLKEIDAIYFSSSSCVKFFFQTYKVVPKRLKFFTIGKVTESTLKAHLQQKKKSKTPSAR